MLERIMIEAAKAEDMPAILDVMLTANMHHVPSPEMPELDWRCFYVARVGGEVVGASGYKVLSPREAKTTLMAVKPEYRRDGIGRLLQERRMLAVSDLGIETLWTNADIPETIAWYKRYFGYQEAGKLRKLHEFGRPDVPEWTTLKTSVSEWRRRFDERKKAD